MWQELLEQAVDSYVDETIDYLQDTYEHFSHLRDMVMAGDMDAYEYEDGEEEESEDWDEDYDEE